jgi:hypothetical protein
MSDSALNIAVADLVAAEFVGHQQQVPATVFISYLPGRRADGAQLVIPPGTRAE